jgi:hypothetical protein
VTEEAGEPPQSQFLSQPVEVSARKAGDYLLDVNHRDGGAKARFFLAKGFAAGDWRAFADATLGIRSTIPFRRWKHRSLG